MSIPYRFLALPAVALMLAACGKDIVEPPAPVAVTSPPATTGAPLPPATPSSDPSLPSASSVFAGSDAPAPASAPTTIQTGAVPTDAQEKTALPLPGQAGSHSAPKSSDKSGSAPS